MQQYTFDYASNNSRRIGCLIKTINFRCIHGFAFSQPELFPPTEFEKLERAASAYWEKKLYEDDYREFTDFFRPDCERLQQELRVVDPSALSHASLVEYVAKCYDYAFEFWKLHHTYTMPTMAVVGGKTIRSNITAVVYAFQKCLTDFHCFHSTRLHEPNGRTDWQTGHGNSCIVGSRISRVERNSEQAGCNIG